MSETSEFKDVLKENRRILLAILMIPVAGMIVAIPLIMWKSPDAMRIAIPIILILIAQYLLLVWWVSKRMDRLIES